MKFVGIFFLIALTSCSNDAKISGDDIKISNIEYYINKNNVKITFSIKNNSSKDILLTNYDDVYYNIDEKNYLNVFLKMYYPPPGILEYAPATYTTCLLIKKTQINLKKFIDLKYKTYIIYQPYETLRAKKIEGLKITVGYIVLKEKYFPKEKVVRYSDKFREKTYIEYQEEIFITKKFRP